MVDIIGNSFDGLGIIPSSKMIKGGYRTIIGNGSGLFRQVLSFDKLTFARNSVEYILYNGVLTKQASVNTPATRDIGGRVFMQSEPAETQGVGYSDRLDNSWWNFAGQGLATATPNNAMAPDGTNTACLLTTGSINNQYCYRHGRSMSGAGGVVSTFLKKGTQGTVACLRLNNTGASNLNITPTTSWTRYQAYSAIVNPYVVVYQCWNGHPTYLGWTPGDNHHWWGIQVNMNKKFASSPMPNNSGSPINKPKVDAYYNSSIVPSWFRTRFYFEIITNLYTSAQLAADGGEKYLWSFDAAAGAVRCYINGADNKIYVDLVGTGNIITSDALTPTWDGKIKCWFTFDDGANSVLRVNGAGVDAEYTGVQLAAADGHVYWGQREDATLQPSCLISQPEKW